MFSGTFRTFSDPNCRVNFRLILSKDLRNIANRRFLKVLSAASIGENHFIPEQHAPYRKQNAPEIQPATQPNMPLFGRTAPPISRRALYKPVVECCAARVIISKRQHCVRCQRLYTSLSTTPFSCRCLRQPTLCKTQQHNAYTLSTNSTFKPTHYTLTFHCLHCNKQRPHTESSASSKASLRTSIQPYSANSLRFQQPSLCKFTPGGLFSVQFQRGPGGIYKNRPSFYSPICNRLFKFRLNFRAARQIVSPDLFRTTYLFFSTRRYDVIHAVYIAVMVLSEEDRGNRI